ncbi:MAG TPA: efflux RND transporter periplasmic adaptor subunit [Minicystis sp.]|nr:efflux RND transporter periplasmic adaptor subunit [Minicystis sp.]
MSTSTTNTLQEPAPAPSWLSLRSRRTQVLLGAMVISAASISVAAAFTREPPPPPAESPGMKVGDDNVTLAADAPQWKVLRLAPALAASVHWSDPVPARVKIDETKAAKIGSPLAGRVTRVFVELGQPVKEGDPLFSVASPDIAGLRAEREKASVDLEVAKATLDRIKSMVQAKAAPAKDELEANQQYKQALVSLHLAQAKLSSLKVSSKADNEFTLVAPRDGIVVEKNVLPSQQIQSDPLVAIADLSTVWVVADLFEADAVGIEEGTPAKITSPSLPDLALDTKVEMVSAVVDPTRHTVPVRVRVDNPSRSLKPNVFAQMRFQVKPPEGSCEIAASALVSDGAKQYVYVQTDRGRFVRREVVAGSVREGKVPVLKGLKPGEVVVEEGAILLDNQIALAH